MITDLLTLLFQILSQLLNLYRWAVILAAVMSTLAAFGVIDSRNRFVYVVGDFLFRITEPALRPIRNVLPRFGNLDLSPLVLILLISVAQIVLARVFQAIMFGSVQGLVM